MRDETDLLEMVENDYDPDRLIEALRIVQFEPVAKRMELLRAALGPDDGGPFDGPGATPGYNRMWKECTRTETGGGSQGYCFNEESRPKLEVLAPAVPGRLAFSDMDFWCDVNGAILIGEWKRRLANPPGGTSTMDLLSKPQQILAEGPTLHHLAGSMFLAVEGNARTMKVSRFVRAWVAAWGEETKTDVVTGDLDELWRCLLHWSAWNRSVGRRRRRDEKFYYYDPHVKLRPGVEFDPIVPEVIEALLDPRANLREAVRVYHPPNDTLL